MFEQRRLLCEKSLTTRAIRIVVYETVVPVIEVLGYETQMTHLAKNIVHVGIVRGEHNAIADVFGEQRWFIKRFPTPKTLIVQFVFGVPIMMGFA